MPNSPKTIRLTQIDGKLPNLALMRLAHFHKRVGDAVHFRTNVIKAPSEPEYDIVYGSAIFQFSEKRLNTFKESFPGSVIGGTGTGSWVDLESIYPGIPDKYDYSLYPDFKPSIGFLQRGCRLKCKFCVVPKKEGKPQRAMTVMDLWRGTGHVRHLHILDNDFFSIPEWQENVDMIRYLRFKVCLTQGINIRLVTEEAAKALATIDYRDSKFKNKRLYTAWDNLKDEKVFFRGIDRLEAEGIPPRHVMAYMLVGYDPKETWERLWHRYSRMKERGIMPYPMVYDRTRKDLLAFQRWVIRGYHRFIPWDEYDGNPKNKVVK